MKPRIKDGHPIGRYLRPNPNEHHPPIYLCCCESCAVSGSIVVLPDSGEAIPGQYFYSEYAVKEHLSDLRTMKRLSEVGLAEPDFPPFPAFLPAPALSPLNKEHDAASTPIVQVSVTLPLPNSSPQSDVPSTMPSISNEARLAYEFQRLDEIIRHLERQETYTYWNPVELQFRNPIPIDLPEHADLNFLQSLLSDSHSNSSFRGHMEWLSGVQDSLSEIRRSSAINAQRLRMKCELAQRKLDKALADICTEIRKEWKLRLQLTLEKQERIHVTSFSYHDIEPADQIFFLLLVVAAVLHLICGLSMIPMSFFLRSMRLVCELQGSPVDQTKVQLPQDVRTVTKRLDLHTNYTTYVCCPKCFHLYSLENYPEHCSNKFALKSEPCNRRLRPPTRASNNDRSTRTKVDDREVQPARTYNHQNLKQWIGWMHNRRDIERYLERPYSPDPPQNGIVSDVWESEKLRNFNGPDGKRFMSPENSNETRLIFTLNEDGFNPLGNRIAGKKASVGGIYLVCLNLPPSLRHKQENMFLVGIIPGPKEPSQHQINYILKPLVDDLQQLWQPGIFVAQTPNHPKGRLVKAALLQLVCDMPAARLLGGFAHFSAEENPCSLCKESNLNNLDPDSFISRTNEEHRRHARAWLDAESEEERTFLYVKNGVRWSELLRLEYWDPVQDTVVDSMHGFYLRIFQRHCREIWGMSVKLEDCDGLWEVEEPTDEEKIAAKHVFKYKSKSALAQLRTNILRYLVLQEGLDYRRKKKKLLETLLELRAQRKWPLKATDDTPNPPLPSSLSQTPRNEKVVLETVEDIDQLQVARQAFLTNQPRARMKTFAKTVILELCKEYNVELPKTPTGRLSNNKEHILDALMKHARARIGSADIIPASTEAPSQRGDRSILPTDIGNPSQSGLPLESADEYSRLCETAPKSHIDKMGRVKLAGICRVIVSLLRSKARATAAIKGLPNSPVPVHGDHNEHPFENPDEDSADSDSDSASGLSSDHDLDYDAIPSETKQMRDFVHKHRFELGITGEDGRVLKKSKKRSRKKRLMGVLGKETLAEIREDMQKLRIPSWMARAPGRPGEAEQGKFSADQWRTFCTVNLPITLIRLWGSSPKEERRYKMLVNFMHLVTAVRLASMRVMTEKWIQDYEHHMQAYLSDLASLYPHTNITPYQHMALHFGKLLRRFGPVHSWRCFAFERFNYTLQKTSTNNKFGDLEKTMFSHFCMTQRLKAIFHGEKLPSAVQSMVSLYQECFESDTRGTRITDTSAFEDYEDSSPQDDSAFSTRMEPGVYEALQSSFTRIGVLSTSVNAHNRFKQQGLEFAPSSRSFPNAQVVYNLPGGEWSAGCIQRIFTTAWTTSDKNVVHRTFAQVLPYGSLSKIDAQYDPYRVFGLSGGRLFYTTTEQRSLILPIQHVHGHFGYTAHSEPLMSRSTFHALPLNKVNLL